MTRQTRRKFLKTAAVASLAASQASVSPRTGLGAEARPFQVASYDFPNYHLGDARNEKLKGRG